MHPTEKQAVLLIQALLDTRLCPEERCCECPSSREQLRSKIRLCSMSEETTRRHKSVGNWAVLVPLLTALLVPSCNKSLHLLQGRNAIKVERGCQMGSEKRSHWNGLWFPRDNRIPLFVQRLPGSWQHRHLGSFGRHDFFFQWLVQTVLQSTWKCLFLEHYAQEWQRSCQTCIDRKSWMKKSWMKAWEYSGLAKMPQKGQKPTTSQGMRRPLLSHWSWEHSLFL